MATKAHHRPRRCRALRRLCAGAAAELSLALVAHTLAAIIVMVGAMLLARSLHLAGCGA